MNPAAAHSRQCYALIAGGGTTGHVQPALAVARALVDRGHKQSSIELVGSERGIEARLVPEAGFELTLLPGRGLERKLSWQNVKSLGALAVAFARAWRLVGRRRPRVVLSVGGYASVPCALAAVVRRIPIVVAEQNATPGAANRLVSRFAKACAVSFPDTPLPRAVVTGNPVRAEVLAIDRARDGDAARSKLGVEPGRRLVLIFGGSLGALRINRAAVDAARLWAGRSDLHLRHAVGERDWDEITGGGRRCRRGAAALRGAALRRRHAHVSGRGGGGGVPVRGQHQLRAAGRRPARGADPLAVRDRRPPDGQRPPFGGRRAAVVVPDAELNGARLIDEVDALLAAPDRLAAMSAAARAAARPTAAADIATLVEAHARA